MSRLRLAPSTSQVQSAQFVNDYISHPDYRLVAAFFLGWVFLSSLRHVWFSAFLQELMWALYEIANRLRGRAVTSERFPQEKPGDASAHRSSLEQRDGLVLILCLGFMLASLASFLSLLTFYPYGSRGACAFVIAATSIASQVARVFGLVILIHNLKNRSVRTWELRIFFGIARTWDSPQRNHHRHWIGSTSRSHDGAQCGVVLQEKISSNIASVISCKLHSGIVHHHSFSLSYATPSAEASHCKRCRCYTSRKPPIL